MGWGQFFDTAKTFSGVDTQTTQSQLDFLADRIVLGAGVAAAAAGVASAAAASVASAAAASVASATSC